MSRRKKVEEEKVEDEVVMRWSKNKIAIATVVVVLMIFGGLYAISLLSQNPKVLGERASDKPKIKIPDERDVENILESAQDELSNINAKDIIESQPKIKKIIDDLTSLTGSSVSAKSLICDSLCK